jgi:hypothetical protein
MLMTLNAKFAYDALWFAHPLLQAAVAGMMLRRKLHRTFPAFLTYIVFQIAVFALTFPLRDPRFYPIFYYVYWGTNALSVILGFRVIHEVFLDVFRPYHTLRDLGSVLFKWAGLVMLMVAGVVAASVHGGDQGPLPAGILILERSVRVVQCGLVLFLLVFSRYLGTSWRQKSFGIALGFGFFAWVELSLVALQNFFNSPTVSFVNMITYNLTILIWFGYTLAKSPTRDPASQMLRPQRWEQSLNDLHNPVPADSLIPMFESMVDRALSKSNADPTPQPEKVAVGENASHRTRFTYSPTPQGFGSKT